MIATLALFAALSALLQDPPPPPPPEEYLRFDRVLYRDRVETDGALLRTIEGRVLLRNAAAVTEFGQLGTYYIDGFGEVTFEDLTILKPNGRVVEIRGQIEDVNPFGLTGMPVAADVRYRKLTIPGLEPGDTLSYRIVHRARPLAPGKVFGEMELTPLVSDPVQVFELDLPRDAAIRVRLRAGLGADWEALEGPADRLVRRLSLKVPRVKAGKGGFTKAEISAFAEPDVLYTSFRSWEEVAHWWWELSRSRLEPDDGVKTEAVRLTQGKTTAREKLEALYAFVAANIRYLSVSFGVGRMQPRPAAEVLANRYGDCKDKHALLAALGTAIGIDVRPVLVHSFRADLRDDVPGPQQFDHMISVARLGADPAEWLWLDATDALAVPGQLGGSLRDKRALLIEASGGARLVRTPAEPPFVPTHDVEMEGALDAGGVLRGHLVWRFRSDAEPRLRYLFAVTPQDRRAELVQASLARSWKDGKVTNVSTSDPADLTAPFRIEFDAERPAAEKSETALWLPLADFELPVPRKETTPGEPSAEFLLREFTVRAEVRIPEGTSARAPLSVSLERPFGRFTSAYAVEGTLLRVTRTLKLSRPSLATDDVASYEAFRKAIDTDRDQEFLLVGGTASTPSAGALRDQGLAAFERKDYGQAVELLRKATESDPKLKDGLNELGRALRQLGRNDDALAAFTRQIETDPFHESAYAERAYTLMAMDRSDEAERDLLKQIEVAPFKAWSYEKVAERRERHNRLGEAADYYGRAAAIEPKEAEHWADLGRVLQRGGRAAEAREALQRAQALDPPDWLKILAARTYADLGDWLAAGDLAATTIAPIEARLARLSPDSLGEDDLYWVGRLADAWGVIGGAALAAADLPKARRYLEGAWTLGLLPEAALKLAELHLRESRPAAAARLLCMASSMVGGLPPEKRARAKQKIVEQGADCGVPDALLELRTVKLGGAKADFNEEVLLLVEPDGRVTSVRNLTQRNAKGLDALLAQVGPLRLELSPPDERPFKAVRRGVVACSSTSGCVLILDVPGSGPLHR